MTPPVRRRRIMNTTTMASRTMMIAMRSSVSMASCYPPTRRSNLARARVSATDECDEIHARLDRATQERHDDVRHRGRDGQHEIAH